MLLPEVPLIEEWRLWSLPQSDCVFWAGTAVCHCSCCAGSGVVGGTTRGVRGWVWDWGQTRGGFPRKRRPPVEAHSVHAQATVTPCARTVGCGELPAHPPPGLDSSVPLGPGSWPAASLRLRGLVSPWAAAEATLLQSSRRGCVFSGVPWASSEPPVCRRTARPGSLRRHPSASRPPSWLGLTHGRTSWGQASPGCLLPLLRLAGGCSGWVSLLPAGCHTVSPRAPPPPPHACWWSADALCVQEAERSRVSS